MSFTKKKEASPIGREVQRLSQGLQSHPANQIQLEALAEQAARARDFEALDLLLEKRVIHAENILQFCINQYVFAYLFKHIQPRPLQKVLDKALSKAVFMGESALVLQLEALGAHFASDLHEAAFMGARADKNTAKAVKTMLKNSAEKDLLKQDALGATPWHYALASGAVSILDSFQQKHPFKREDNSLLQWAQKEKKPNSINWLHDHRYFANDREFEQLVGGKKNAGFAVLSRINLYADKPWQTKIKKAGGPWRFYRCLTRAMRYFVQAQEEGQAPLAAIIKVLEKNLEFSKNEHELKFMSKLIEKK